MPANKKSKQDKNDPSLQDKDDIKLHSNLNREAIKAFIKKKQRILSLNQYIEGVLSGDRFILSQAITLIESLLPHHQDLAQLIIEKCISHSGKSLRVGITGIPGAGKSTFIEALGTHLTSQGNKIAVLTVDPSSKISHGSILGDKTRMEKLANDKNAYIRPSPSSGYGGGVAQKTMEAIILCEAAGFNNIFVETVGVGQSETTVHSMVDFFLLLTIAGAGDDLQGIKKGIIEMADGIVINKADGDNLIKSENAKNQYQKTLQFLAQKTSGWTPKAMTCSSINKTGLIEIWNMILDHKKNMNESGQFLNNRNKQKLHNLYDTLNQKALNRFYQNEKVKNKIKEMEDNIINNKISAYQAAQRIFELYITNNKNIF